MSILSELFHGGKNPADSARPYLDQIPGMGKKYYNPYITEGREAGDLLGGEYKNLINDPNALIDKAMSGYKPSEYYQFQKDMLGKELGAASAAGGIAGTPFHQQQQGQMVQGLLSKDMQDYLGNVLNAYQTGLSGEKDIYGKGFDATQQLTDLLGGSLNQKAGLAFQGQSQKNQNQADFMNALVKALGALGGGLTGGGLGSLGSLFSGGFGSGMYGGG